MSYNAKNYTEQGGEVTHIGGKLIIEEGAEVEGLDSGGSSYTLPTASAKTLGGVKAKARNDEPVEVAVDGDGKLYVPAYPVIPQLDKQADSVAADAPALVADFNKLLKALQDSSLMKAE